MYKRPLIVRLINRHLGALVWVWSELTPCLAAVAVLGVLFLATLITIGEYPSGPVADLSTRPTILIDIPSYQHPHSDPGPGITLASRASQDVYEVRR